MEPIVSCDEVGAMLCFADCVPVIVVFSRRTFAVVHAGWRGVMARIAESAVERVVRGTTSSRLVSLTSIGPHIHACHFEVGEDLACRFANEFGPSVLTDDRHVSLSAALRCGLTARRRRAPNRRCWGMHRMRRRKTLFFVSSERRTVWQACRVCCSMRQRKRRTVIAYDAATAI